MTYVLFVIKAMMEKIKRKWLPIVIMSEEGSFDKNWENYMAEYESEVDTKSYLDRLNIDIQESVNISPLNK